MKARILCIHCRRPLPHPQLCDGPPPSVHSWKVWRIVASRQPHMPGGPRRRHAVQRHYEGEVATTTTDRQDALAAAQRRWGSGLFDVELQLEQPAASQVTPEPEPTGKHALLLLASVFLFLLLLWANLEQQRTEQQPITTDSPLDAAP